MLNSSSIITLIVVLYAHSSVITLIVVFYSNVVEISADAKLKYCSNYSSVITLIANV